MGAAGLLPQPRAQQQFCPSVPLLGGCREPPLSPGSPLGFTRCFLSSCKRCRCQQKDVCRNEP